MTDEQRRPVLVVLTSHWLSMVGVSLVTLAVAWVMAHPAVTAPIIGASRPDQLDASLAAAQYALDSGLKQQLDEVTHEYRMGDAPR